MFKNKYLPLYIAIFALILSGCEDEGSSTGPEQRASLSVSQQGTVDGNQVVIDEATVSQSSWVVIHRSNSAGDGPMVPGIIGKAALDAGTNTDVVIELQESVSDGETLWAMLHSDTGVEGEYEFSGSDSPDQPITAAGEVVVRPFTINQTDPSVSAQNQANDEDGFQVSVDAAEDGWIVLHRANAAGDGPAEVIGYQQVSAGTNSDISVSLNDGKTVNMGETLFAMLHYDTGEEGKYEFDGPDTPDQPVVFNGNVVLTSFMVQ